jgi:hypothetical protein
VLGNCRDRRCRLIRITGRKDCYRQLSRYLRAFPFRTFEKA